MTASTSREAYHQEQPKIESQLERLKNFFRRYPTMRWTDQELAGAFHWKPNVVWSRRSQLRKDGYIEDAGTKTNPLTGHRVVCYKWRLPQ